MAINSDLNKKLDLILENQKKILKSESEILGEEEKILDKEKKIEELEKKALKHEKNIEKSEKEIYEEFAYLEKKLKDSISIPLKNITKRDIIKGFIGSFIGVMSHFAFTKGATIAIKLDFYRSTILYLTAFLIIFIMLYYSGFKNVEKRLVFKFMPLRATLLYTVSIFTIIFINLLFGEINFGINFIELYNIVAANIILGVIGAGTADLIGRNE